MVRDHRRGPRVVLTIAGSDSGGGAGIQADLKTFAALGAYGASVITAVTAQNTLGVTGVHPVPAAVVAAQIDAVLADLPVVAVKVGMVADPEVAAVIAERAARLPHLVVDPVLVATSGSRLGAVDAVRVLLPYAQVLTPNRFEAGALLDRDVRSTDDMVAAAAALVAAGPRAVVVTGSADATDVLHHDGGTAILRGRPIETRNNHGSGCTFSSAIAVRVAAGDDVATAVRNAKRYVATALRGSRAWRIGAGPGPLDHFSWEGQ